MWERKNIVEVFIKNINDRIRRRKSRKSYGRKLKTKEIKLNFAISILKDIFKLTTVRILIVFSKMKVNHKEIRLRLKRRNSTRWKKGYTDKKSRKGFERKNLI